MAGDEKLLPCPWCGETNVSTEIDANQGYKWGYAYCAECGSRSSEVRTQYDQTAEAPWRAHALKEWNTRTTTSDDLDPTDQ